MQDLLKLIEAETGIAADTFRSEHIGHPDCNAMSPVFMVNGKLEPLFKYISKEDSLAFFGNEPRNKIMATFAGKKEIIPNGSTPPPGDRPTCQRRHHIQRSP